MKSPVQRDKLVRELLDTLPRVRVAAATALVLQQRTGRSDFREDELSGSAIEDFVRSLSVRQLKLLRTIALDLELTGEGRVH